MQHNKCEMREVSEYFLNALYVREQRLWLINWLTEKVENYGCARQSEAVTTEKDKQELNAINCMITHLFNTAVLKSN